MILVYELWDDENITISKCLNDRLNELKNNLNKYVLSFIRKNGGNVSFDLDGVVRIKFAVDGVEVVNNDSSTAFIFYSEVIEFALVYKPTLEKMEN